MEKVKEISYLDKGYSEKRKILRKFNFSNINCHELTNKVLYKILSKIKDNPMVDKTEVIKMLLIDGFVAYEKIYDDDKLIGLKSVDPLTFIMKSDGSGKLVWHQNKDTEYHRILFDTQVLYVSFDSDYTSFVEMIFTKVVNDNSKYTIKMVIDRMVDTYNKNFLKIT